jgi:hypothetical protein
MRNTQVDASSKTRALDMVNGNVRGRRRGAKVKLSPKEVKLASVVESRLLKKLKEAESVKYIDVGTGITSPATIPQMTAGTFGLLIPCTTSIIQGAGQAARTADTVWLDKVELNFALKYNFSSSTLAQDYINAIRTTLFQWKENTALVLPTPSSIFQNVASTSVYAKFDFELRDQYHIHFDDMDSVTGFYDSTTAFAFPTERSIRQITKTISLRNSRLLFNPTATTGSNHLYLALTSDTVSGPAPLFSGTIRTYFRNDPS